MKTPFINILSGILLILYSNPFKLYFILLFVTQPWVTLYWNANIQTILKFCS